MRSIIHIDMDCFYAAIEMRENPELKGKPMAVGGRSQRGVLSTANYEARQFGCRSAMPVFKALTLCPELIVVPGQYELYREESQKIQAIMGRFTQVIEPLSLDEAYLDVSHLETKGISIAREIRKQIEEETQLTASAGIAPNKMLAKIASDWEKPNGQFRIQANEIEKFMKSLPVQCIPGVGKKFTEKLASLQIRTCGDLQALSQIELARRFGKSGIELFDRCRGIDNREVKVEKIRKSLSKERTFSENASTRESLLPVLDELTEEVRVSLEKKYDENRIKSLFVKLKFADFESTTAEKAATEFEAETFGQLLVSAWVRGQGREVRLLGVGVKFATSDSKKQLEFEL